MSSDAAGTYAAAKALGNAVYLAPSAVSGVVITRVSRMPEISIGAFLLRVMALGTAVTLPLLIVFLVLGRQLTALIFGNRYPHVSDPLALIAVGMAIYGLYLLLSGAWRGMGRLAIDAWATGAGTVMTVGLGLVLVPRIGLIGAAGAFSAGSVTQLLTIGAYTLWALSNRPTGVDLHRPRPASVVTVADRFPARGDPLVELAATLENVRVEAVARPDAPDAAVARTLRIDYLEDDGLAARTIAIISLFVRHPFRLTREAARGHPSEPGLLVLAPAVRRLEREPGARVLVLGGDRARAVAERLARLAGRPAAELSHR